MNLAVFNARSIRNKTVQIIELLKDNDIDLCCFSETWMKENDSALETEFYEKGYNLYHDPRNGRGGGTGVAVKTGTKVTKQFTKKFSSFEVTELLIKNNGQKMRVCSVYRSVTKSSLPVFISEFEEYLRGLLCKPGKPIIAGDLNFHLENHDDVAANQFKTLLALLGYHQHVHEATHVHGGTLTL